MNQKYKVTYSCLYTQCSVFTEYFEVIHSFLIWQGYHNLGGIFILDLDFIHRDFLTAIELRYRGPTSDNLEVTFSKVLDFAAWGRCRTVAVT